MIALKRKVLEELLRDPEFSRRLEECGSFEELARLLEEFARKRGYRVVRC